MLYLSCDGCNKSIMLKEEKLYMCFVDLVIAFDRLPRKVLELALRKKEIPDVLVRSVMCLYEGA